MGLFRFVSVIGGSVTGLSPRAVRRYDFSKPLRLAVEDGAISQQTSVLDYGCGKAKLYDIAELETPDGKTLRGLKEIWGVNEITLYDPGYEPYSQLPSGTFDGVICSDVLEHCPEEDIDWIIDELFAFADLYLICTIACYPATKFLPNGENAHITLKKPGWWIDKIQMLSPVGTFP